jgi:hypothetical protein
MKLHMRRSSGLRLALGALLAASALFFSPRLAQQVYAQDEKPTCSANCANGSCSGNGNCTCTCSFWGGNPTCTCSGSPPVEQ